MASKDEGVDAEVAQTWRSSGTGCSAKSEEHESAESGFKTRLNASMLELGTFCTWSEGQNAT